MESAAKYDPDPEWIRLAVKAAADDHPNVPGNLPLLPDIVRDVARYVETGDPTLLDVTIFRRVRDFAVMQDRETPLTIEGDT